MKKIIKSAFCFMLALVFCCSIIPVISADNEFDAIVKANSLTDGEKLFTVAQITNLSQKDGVVTILKGVYNASGEEIRAEKVKVSAPGGKTVTENVYVDYDSSKGEVAKVFFWKENTLEPLCDEVISTLVPEGSIEEGKIEITSSMVFASAESEGDHRVTNVADGDADTYWSAKGVTRTSRQSVTAALEHEHTITKVGIAFGLGEERQYVFTVSTSSDGKNYTEVLDETTSELTNEMQYFDIPMSVGKFVRFTIVERVEPDEDNWVRISEIEAYGMLIPYDTGEEVELYSFDDIDDWTIQNMDERNNSDYVPSLGEKLYAESAPLPEGAAMGTNENALHLVDYVGRTTDETLGAGGVIAAKRYQTNADREKYNISFNMFIPSVMENGENSDTYWSGFSLTDELVSGGDDLKHYAAIQIRFEDDNGKVKLKYLRSNYFNEGSLFDFMSTGFEKDRLWTISMDVDPIARRSDITVTDGINTETRPIYFSYNDAEYARISTWSGLEAKWLVFNTGVGKKTEIYVDEVSVKHYEPKEDVSGYETCLGHIDMTEENNGEMTFKNISDDLEDYEGSLGENLYAELTKSPEESGINGDALHLYDAVGRATDEELGAGGVMAYVNLPVPENPLNSYRVDFTLYAPVADEYGGFNLSNGIDGSYGMQMRFKPSKADENNLQLNQYEGNTFNGGTYEAVVGSYTPLIKGNPWKISIKVDMLKREYVMTIDDGVNVQERTKSMPTKYENWVDKNLNVLSFNTGIGGTADIYVGDITVTDLGFNPAGQSAINGILRLVAVNGTGKMLHHQGNETSDFAEKQDPAYTRFVERTGLMDSDGVSFEVMNRPGYFLTIVPGTDNVVQVQPFSNTARFKANATFYKQAGGIDPKGYGKSTVAYASYRDPNRYLYDNSGQTVVWKRHSAERTVFYLRNEASNSRVSDNFNGTSLDTSKWMAQYPWGDSHNHYGLCRASAIEVKNGNITLKANRIGDNEWPTSSSGKNKGATGIDLTSFGFGGWKKWQAYVGVICPAKNYNAYDGSVKYWSQSYMEGSFKQPDCGYGYWTAFWLAGANAWPPETDIFEYLSSSGQKGAHGWFTNMHYSSSVSDGNWYQGSNLRTQYHRYALDWGYDYMDMYYDGQLFRRYTGYIPDSQDDQGGMCLIINTGIGGWESALPSQYGIGMSLQWFRSFQY
ncbi:MAG: discoidin domain-containing protein [Clostridia bacterium]